MRIDEHMTFFEQTFGFDETAAEYLDNKEKLERLATIREVLEGELYGQVAPSQNNLPSQETGAKSGSSVVGENCDFAVNGRNIKAGIFYTPSVAELHDRVARVLATLTPEERQALQALQPTPGELIALQNITGDSRSLHCDPIYDGGVVQAASQFNYLEFPSPNTIPEKGITQYVFDRTQGPACATACAAGTAFRNYLARCGTQRGQTKENQLNGLDEITTSLLSQVVPPGTEQPSQYYKVRNGYIESSPSSLQALNALLDSKPDLADSLVRLLRIGVQEDTQVTDEKSGKRSVKKTTEEGKIVWRLENIREDRDAFFVTQAYCSALSVGYSRCCPDDWKKLACIVLNGTYEATILLGILNTLKLLRRERPAHLPPILLTKVGGGVFANEPEWIQDAMRRAFGVAKQYGVPLDIRIVHYAAVEPDYDEFVQATKQSGVLSSC